MNVKKLFDLRGKPFFLWLNPTRMHVTAHLSQKYEAMRNSKNGRRFA